MASSINIRRFALAANAVAFFWLTPTGAARADEFMYGSHYRDQSYSAINNSTGYDTFWVRADYLYWQLNGADLPPLVTSSPTGTPVGNAGVLGLQTTDVLVGNEVVNDHWRSGWTISAGFWIDPESGWAITGEFLDAGRDSFTFSRGPTNAEILARPFFNAQTQAEASSIVDAAGQFSGRINIAAYTDFQSASGGMQYCLLSDGGPLCGRCTTLNLVGGYRFYRHDSTVVVTEDKISIMGNAAGILEDSEVFSHERFAASNDFHGGELGLSGRIQRSEWWLEGLSTLAVGGSRRQVVINGQTTIFDLTGVDAPVVAATSLLASGLTNSGRYIGTKCVVIPRFHVGFGCQLTQRLSARLGYNVIIWPDVAQAAEHLPPIPAGQLGPASDPRNAPPPPTIPVNGGPDPAFPGLQSSTIVAHGMDLGLELKF